MSAKACRRRPRTPRASRNRAMAPGVLRPSVSTHTGQPDRRAARRAAVSGRKSSRPCRETQRVSCHGRARRAAASCRLDAAGSTRRASGPKWRASRAPMPKNSGSPSASTATRRPRARHASMAASAGSSGAPMTMRSPGWSAKASSNRAPPASACASAMTAAWPGGRGLPRRPQPTTVSGGVIKETGEAGEAGRAPPNVASGESGCGVAACVMPSPDICRPCGRGARSP